LGNKNQSLYGREEKAKGNLPFPLFRIAYATPAQSSLFFGIHPGPFMPKTL
jgi:hypothetical protein